MKYLFYLTAFSILSIVSCKESNSGQKQEQAPADLSDLRKALLDTLANYDADVALSVIGIESGDTLSIHTAAAFPMQSVFKFPLALCVLKEVEKGNISLQQHVFISQEMRKRFPQNDIERLSPGMDSLPVDLLIRYMIVHSDNLSCDLLFDLVGGTEVANSFIHQLGYTDIHIKHTEVEIGQEPEGMHANASTPTAMSALLMAFFERKILNDSHTAYLLNYMINDSTSHKRLGGQLPAGTKMAHKTGTGMSADTLIEACNDVGIIYLPDGKHLAVAVFVRNSKEGYEQTEKLIAILNRMIYDHFTSNPGAGMKER